jgi:hypothetical protein
VDGDCGWDGGGTWVRVGLGQRESRKTKAEEGRRGKREEKKDESCIDRPIAILPKCHVAPLLAAGRLSHERRTNDLGGAQASSHYRYAVLVPSVDAGIIHPGNEM